MTTASGYNPLQFLDDAGISLTTLANTHTTDLKLAWLGQQFIEQGLRFALTLLDDQNRGPAEATFQTAIQLCSFQPRHNGAMKRDQAISAIGSQQQMLNLYVQKAITGFDFLDICAFNAEMWNSTEQLNGLVGTIQAQLYALEKLIGNEQFNDWLKKIMSVALQRSQKLESDALAEELTLQGLPLVDSNDPLIKFIEIILAGNFPRNGLTLLHHILDPMMVGPAMMQLQELVRYEGVVTRGATGILGENNEFFKVNPLGIACLPALDNITLFALGGYGMKSFVVTCLFTVEIWSDAALLLKLMTKVEEWAAESDKSEMMEYLAQAHGAALARFNEISA